MRAKTSLIDVRPKTVFDPICGVNDERRAVAVEITVNWHFVGEGEEAQVTYGIGQAEPAAPERNGDAEAFPFVGGVVPLSSSVLAPGLSMPVAAS